MTIEVTGTCDSRFEHIKDTIANSVETGADLGVSFAVTIDGEMVVDLHAGHLDEEKSRPWQADTIVNVYSTTKTMSFLSALLLADRGQLDFDEKVAKYWPEFAQNGKENVKVWHLMDHAAGLSGFETPMTAADLYNWDKVTGALAAQKPWWEPGTGTGYHAITQGYLIGEVVRRITGKTIGRFFQDEIAGPLSADFLIGVPESEFHRVGNLIPPPAAIDTGADPTSVAARTFSNPSVDAKESWARAWRMAEIPAANGHGNARSVAAIQAIVANKGEAGGVRLLSRETAESVMKERIRGVDKVLGAPIGFGLGYGLNSREMPLAPNEHVCFWGGYGGSIILIDQDARMSISFVMNKMHGGLMGDPRSAHLIAGIYGAL